MKTSAPHQANRLTWIFPDGEPHELRADRFLQARIPELSRRMLWELFSAGNIRVNRQAARKGDKFRTGDRISVLLPAGLEAIPLPDPELTLKEIYRDQDLLVLDKPGLIPCIPLRAWETGTLANALVSRYPPQRGVGPKPLEAGLVHRLDGGTSGLLVAARNPESWDRLHLDLIRRRWVKKYLALVQGRLEGPLILQVPLANHPKNPKKMIPVPSEKVARRGRAYPAETRVLPLRPSPRLTLIEVDLVSGVRHQIRAHLAGINHPVVGDRLYGPESNPLPGLDEGRLFLHAHHLSLTHPGTGKRLTFSSPLPDDLRTELETIERMGFF